MLQHLALGGYCSSLPNKATCQVSFKKLTFLLLIVIKVLGCSPFARRYWGNLV